MEGVLFGIDYVNKIRQAHGKETEHAAGHDGNDNPNRDGKSRVLEQLIGRAETADQGDYDTQNQPEGQNS